MKVSVITRTHNRSHTILQTLNSILMQETDFEYEIIIQDDCSTDDTPFICQNLKSQYPKKIKYYRNKKNEGAGRNLFHALKNAKGKYIALLDDDDLWIDNNKLQYQVDFLEHNPNFILHHHDCALVDQDLNFINTQSLPALNRTLSDLWLNSNILTLSAMFDAKTIKNLPEDFGHTLPEDWYLFLFISNKGLVRYDARVMGMTRYETGGWSKKTSTYRRLLSLHMLLKAYEDFGYKHKETVAPVVFAQCHEFLNEIQRDSTLLEKEFHHNPNLMLTFNQFLTASHEFSTNILDELHSKT